MDLLNLVAKLTLDKSDYENGLRDSENDANSIGSRIGSAIGTVGKVSAVGLGVAATAVGKLTWDATNAFKNYEQLVGGVETLFGTGGKDLEQYAASVGKTMEEAEADFNNHMYAQQTVLENADKAFDTAGMSANEYMETVTGFAASLIQSLNGDELEAAKKADMAISDMSDNANKMGTAMESIQYAYSGFAKQNYTMLDNLKLGYGGTRSEMERLLADASEIAGVEFNIDNYKRRRQWAEKIMDVLGCTYDKNQVGMFLWGKIPADIQNVEDLTERVLHEARVFITPGFIFGSNGERYIRISLCAKEDKIKQALERISLIKRTE